MTMDRHNSDHHLEPLPSEYDEDLVRIDAMLSRAVADRSVPEALTQRVYDASVSHLPKQRALKFSPARHVQHLPMLSRLSMAAAVLLAVVVGIVFLRSPGMPSLSDSLDHFAYNGATVTPIPAAATRQARSLSMEQEWLLLDSVQLAHLAEIRHLSLADVTDDLAWLVEELEM